MMIALRGPIRRNTKTKNKEGTNASVKTPLETPVGEWIWTGFWAFGSLPQGLDHTKKSGKRAITNNGARPFVYKFQEVTDASTIEVPSLQQVNLPSKEEEGEDNDTELTAVEEDKKSSKEEKLLEQSDIKASASDLGNEKSETNANQEKKQTTESESLEQCNENSPPDTDRENQNSSVEKQVQSTEKEGNDNVLDEKENNKKSSEDKNENDANVNSQNEKSQKNEEEALNSNKNESIVETKPKQEEEKEEEKNKAKTDSNENNCEDGRITFASENVGEKYTDAGLKYSQKCPIGGCWKGYFENVSTRKDRNSSRVQETFYLFFNSTPPSNARVQFSENEQNEEENSEKAGQSTSRLPTNHIHVRGMGVNQFGTFEIIGGFNLETGVLNCQRMYVLNMEDPVTEEENTKSTRSNNLSKTVGRMTTRKNSQRTRRSFGEMSNYGSAISQSSPSDRPYYTRKRQMNWKRASWGAGSTSIDNESSNRRNSTTNVSSSSFNGKKRARIASEADINPVGSKGSNLVSSVGNTPSPGTKEGKSSRNNSISDMTSNSSPNSIKRSSSKDGNKEANNSPQQNSTFSSAEVNANSTTTPTKQKKSGKTSNSKNSNYVETTNSPNTVTAMTLPLAGDPLEARWRAAHYLYYQNKSENSSLDTTNTGTTLSNNGTHCQPSQVTTSFVIYEGELNHGKMMRDGFGVCLYDNGTLYEGHWKKNKEHGYGTLFSSDRKRTIYEGDWERGRMHGRGIYYYHMYRPGSETTGNNDVDSQQGGSYSGDFKENARHGNGIYKLPDGSVYDGEWRENQPSGRGTLRWMDGSLYIGMWKDGKRHGQGTLTVSDGFSYEGSWINNGMEGRGIAIYPNGQRYEGMWAGGKREGRGTIIFNNGAIYEGRFREDLIEGQGTLKMTSNALIPKTNKVETSEEMKGVDTESLKDAKVEETTNLQTNETEKVINADKNGEQEDWMIPIEFQSDIGHIHEKAGFTTGGE